MNSLDLPPPRTYKDVPLIPPVDPEDLKRVWDVKPPWTRDSHKDACSPGADVGAVVKRRHMVNMLVRFKLLGPWTHEGKLDDAVFRVAAMFPLHESQSLDYQIPGDELWSFDPNAFVQRLVEETGIAHVWEPVAIKVSEDGRRYVLTWLGTASSPEAHDREARSKTRQLLWNIWRRFSGMGELIAPRGVDTFRTTTALFDDFLIANTELVERVLNEFRNQFGPGKELLMEIERKAMRQI